MRHIDKLGLGNDCGSVGEVAADHDGIGVEGLGEFERTGAGRLEVLRQAEMVESIHAVGAAHGLKTGRGEEAAEELGRGFANPLEAGLAGTVVERKHEQDAAAIGGGTGRGGVRRCLGARARRNGENHDQRESGT